LDTKNASIVQKEQKRLEDKLASISNLQTAIGDIDFLFEMYELEQTEEIEQQLIDRNT
jgi:hypothetical protein